MARIPRLLPLIAIAIGGVVAVRAVGAGPGLLDGATAWAQDAASAVSPAAGAARARPAAAVCALTEDQLAQQAGMSPAELRIIQSLMKRRTELDARDTDFATTLPLMAAAEQKLDAKVQALNALKGEIQGLLGQVDAKEKEETDRLVAVYSAMRPREAAAVFATLDDSVRLPIAAAMRPRSLSAVMAQMQPAQARELTEKLARRYQAQQLAAKAAVANAAVAAPQANAPQAAPPQSNPPRPTQAAATANAQAPQAAGANAPAPTPNAAAASQPRPAAAPPRRPAPRPAARPAPERASPGVATAATPPAAGPQPYQAPTGTASTPTTPAQAPAPRQSVQ